MQKNSTTLNFTKATFNYITKRANVLGLKNSPYVESVIMTHAFGSGFIPTTTELNNLRNSFLVNGSSNMTGAFRSQIATFNSAGQTAIINFLYRLNLIEGIKISTTIMANLFKGDMMCYFAFGEIGRNRQLVNDYLRSSSRIMYTIGTASAPSDEYLFFSNHQQFTIKKDYPKFAALVNALALAPDTEVIRVHYSELPKIADAISSI